jgi:chloramphenicol-sensitive protein RarD
VDVDTARRGTLLGVAAYVMWGLFPLYWPLLEPGGALEILAHRVWWSLVFVALLLAVSRRAVRDLPRDKRGLTLLGIASVLIGINWGVFIWSVNNDHVIDSSLGYFINPLVSVALGVLVLRETLRRTQWGAVALAAVGVTTLAVAAGKPPWIALTLAVTFGCYGLVKAVVGVGPLEGLTVETAALAPLALGYLGGLTPTGDSTFASHGADHALLLMSGGAVTAIPLLFFAAAVASAPLSQLGVLFYLNPTMQFLVGTLIRHEPLSTGRLIGFVLVWIALAIFTVDSLTNHRRRQLALAAEAAAA